MSAVKFVALLVLAGVLVAPATAAAPEGFRESGRLAPIAAALSGKDVAVECGRTDDAWDALMLSIDAPASATGYAPTDTGVIYLNPVTCRWLEGWLRGKNMPTLERLGWSVLTITHESMHVRGYTNEGATDCAALAAMPSVLRVHFKIRKAATVKTVMAAAWRKHKLSGPVYQGGC